MTQSVVYYSIEAFWDDEYKRLDYANEDFNAPEDVESWKSMGFDAKFTGDLCDMRKPQPTWNDRLIKIFQDKGWQDIGTSYYRMMPGTVLPTHQDRYVKYVKLFNLEHKLSSIRRAVIFLEHWQSGHYAEYQGRPHINWSAGSTVEWTFDTPHMAANIGATPRYTLQITGHL
jgi:hypothetical protein